MELIMLVRPDIEALPVVELLHDVAATVVRGHEALLRGDVVPLEPGFGNGLPFSALYVTLPVYLPNAFATCPGPSGDVVIAWLVPISADERAFVHQHGWSRFEDELVEHNPDLVDWYRPSCIRHAHDQSG